MRTYSDDVLDAPTSHRSGHDRSVILPADFTFESGDKPTGAFIRIRTYGPETGPLVLVAGGISADRFAAGSEPKAGWWREFIRADGPVDLDRFRVACMDFLPDCSEGPCTITTHDQARALAHALDQVGEPRIKAFVGASYGGMVALAFAELFPERLNRLCVISAAHRPDPMATAIRGIQRRIIAFGRAQGAPEQGVALARELAMTTYRSADEFARRFDSSPQGSRAGDPYDACAYLIARGQDYAKIMTPERFETLSDSIDRHRVDPARITTPTCLIASCSDRIVPPHLMADLKDALNGSATLHYIDSAFGHDAFLLETATIGPIIKTFIED